MEEGEQNPRAARIAHLEAIVADEAQGVVHRNKAKIELAQLRDVARLAAENAILERRAKLQAAAAQRRVDAAHRREEAVHRAREAEAQVAGAEKVAEAAIAASKKAVEELQSLREIAGQERHNARTAEQEFEEFARLEREIEREFEDFAGAASHDDEEDGGLNDSHSGRYADGESHDISADHGEDHGEASAAIAEMEAEMRQLSQEGHWKREAENLAYRCDELATALGECEERATAAKADNQKRQAILEDCMQVLERKEKELAKCKRMMRIAYEAEECAQRAAKEANLAARDAADRATTEAEARAASEAAARAAAVAAELQAAKEAARRAEAETLREEEAAESARRAEEAAERAALEEANRTRLVVLVSDGVAEVNQRSDIGNALRLLNDFRIPHEVIDGTEGSKSRETLFAISHIKGHFPQLFSVKGDAGIDDATFLGGYRWLNRHAGELREMFPLPPGGWTITEAQAKDAEISRLTRLLQDERAAAARKTKELEDEVEDLEDSLIKASELLDAEKERSRGLATEVERMSQHGAF